jgi:hypothetical protein
MLIFALYPDGTVVGSTYKSLRVIGAGYNLLYTVWCTGEHELYDMTVSGFSLEIWPIYIDGTLVPLQGHRG